MMRAATSERSLSTQEALRRLGNPRIALELNYVDDPVTYYLTKQDGEYYLTTSTAQVREISGLIPEHGIRKMVQEGFAEILRLREAPFGELIMHCP